MDWPEWWEWELELSLHVQKRMTQREFNEVELRAMLAIATNLRPSNQEGRYLVDAMHDGVPWHVVLEPDESRRRTVVVTAYPVSFRT